MILCASSEVRRGCFVWHSKPASERPNTYALMTAAAGPIRGPRADVRDVQERWIDAREEWDAWERKQWRKEGEMVQQEEVRKKASGIRERTSKVTDALVEGT